tara:strand:+ start:441 stop:638 length:198 start_codon:yes stop_codon:yes gene_type:complete
MQIVFLTVLFGCFSNKKQSIGIIDAIDENVCVIQVVKTEEIIGINPKLCATLEEGDVLWVRKKKQ